MDILEFIAISIFMGLILWRPLDYIFLRFIKKRSYDGVMYVNLEDPMKDVFRLAINDLNGIVEKDDILIKVEIEK